MKKLLFTVSFVFLIHFPGIFSQAGLNARVYLLTCGPGTETYSIYGHSALRIVMPDKNTDNVYNWGVFDFDTPNFAWKFAKGRLDYMVIGESLDTFLQIYHFDQRFVQSQRINLNTEETERLIALVNENLKPENVSYRYDFFYDDCSTRIRDIIEKAIGKSLLYPPAETGEIPTFRNMVGKYQSPYPWLKFGVDLIMGSTSDKKASFRDRMFLPVDMQIGLSEAVISRDGKMIPLLQNPQLILDFDPPATRHRFFISPVFVFTLIVIFIIIISVLIKTERSNKLLDIGIYLVFSILSSLMIFFNFFSDHQQMKWNLNIIWLNPIILICLIALILNKTGAVWFRIVFYISSSFLVLHILLPQEFNVSFIPLVIILAIRSSVRSGFKWNPLTIK